MQVYLLVLNENIYLTDTAQFDYIIRRINDRGSEELLKWYPSRKPFIEWGGYL